ncbi:flagellar hook-basal body complex protein [Clostridium cadaveris]|uniref:flagellar hook-basal body complex protein n=1 Tax=Clostridium cadaveris TaxID=1529 RepID=UPI000C06E941|nr:flagellar hook-basal body complex protein [Clostridium cadaveris]
MYGILNISKSGMSSKQNKMDTISNNIVNANTTGYKKLETEFQDLIRETLSRQSYPTNSFYINNGTGVKSTNAIRNFSQGSLKSTGIMSNLAIDGEGFFRVLKPDNTYVYTRNGEFNIDAMGKIVDDKGNMLDIQFYGGNSYDNLSITKDNLTVNKQGEVFVNDNLVGKVNLYNSNGNNDFISIGDSLFQIRPESELFVQTDSNIIQGYSEMSNVNIGEEFTELISIQRSFQLNSKGITVADDMWSMINNLQSR